MTQKCPFSDTTNSTMAKGAPVVDNQNSLTAGARGPLFAQDLWLNETLADFVREVVPERCVHAKGSGAFGTFTVTHDITKYTRAKIFSKVGKQTEMFARFTTVAGERRAAYAERDIRGFALKFYTQEGNWDMAGNNTPVFFLRDSRKFPDLNKTVKRDPRTNMRSATNTEDFYKGFLRKNTQSGELVWIGCVMVLVISAMAIAIAQGPHSSVMGLVSHAWAGFGAAFGPIGILSLFNRNISSQAALWGMFSGTITVVTWTPLMKFWGWQDLTKL